MVEVWVWVGWCCGPPECTLQDRSSQPFAQTADHSLCEASLSYVRLLERCGICADLPSGTHSYRLEELAYARSGDKGDTANIGET